MVWAIRSLATDQNVAYLINNNDLGWKSILYILTPILMAAIASFVLIKCSGWVTSKLFKESEQKPSTDTGYPADALDNALAIIAIYFILSSIPQLIRGIYINSQMSDQFIAYPSYVVSARGDIAESLTTIGIGIFLLVKAKGMVNWLQNNRYVTLIKKSHGISAPKEKLNQDRHDT